MNVNGASRLRSALFAALLGATFAASAQLYRWTDAQGRVHVTDTPPPPSARNVRSRAVGAGESASPAENQPYALQAAMKSAPVTLYTAPDCAPCGSARALLNARGIPFREISVIDERQAEELKQTVGSLSVPSIKVGGSVQKGFEQGAYQSLLDAAGYPRPGILPPRNQAEPKPEASPKPAPSADEAPADQAPAGPYTPR